MKKKFLIPQIILLYIFCCLKTSIINSQTFPNPSTLSTGQGGIGTFDPIWQASDFWYPGPPPNPMSITYSPALINNNCAPGAWVDPAALPPPTNNANWITGADVNCANNTSDGYRYFRLTLNLPPDCGGFSVTTAGNYVLNFDGYVDNTITDVFINGVSQGISGGSFSTGTQLSISLAGPWLVGTNYVDILVYNFPAGGGPNPYGLLLVASSSASDDLDNDGILDVNDDCPCDAGTNPYGCMDPTLHNCNVDAIRTAFTDAGCIEMQGCSSDCSVYFLNPQFLSGSQAQAFAQTLGSNLVSIQSQAENDCIVSSLLNLGYDNNAVIWIGINDESVEGTFEWYDQSPVTYTNWAFSEPNNAGGAENCVQIYPSNGQWNDLNCDAYNSMSIIEVNLCPVLNMNDYIICLNETANIIAPPAILGSAPYTYNWNNGAVGLSNPVSPTVTTEYYLTVEDRYECLTTDTTLVTVNPLPNVNAGTDFDACQGQQITLSAAGANTYTWNNGVVNGVPFTAATTQTYSVTGTDANGCQNTDDVVVTVYNPPTVNAGPDQTVCAGSVINLSGAFGGGATGATWSSSSGTFSNTSDMNSTYSPAITTGNIDVVLTSNAVTACPAVTDIVNISITPYNALEITAPNMTCNTTINWANLNPPSGNQITGSIGNINFTISQPGVSLQNSPSIFNGAIFPPQYSVPTNVPVVEVASAGPLYICFDQPVLDPQIVFSSIGTPSNTVPINVSSPYNIIWNGSGMTYPNNQTIIGTEGFSIIEFPGAQSCIVLDYLGAEYYSNITIGLPVVTCDSVVICEGSSINLTASGGTNYTWSPAATLSATTGSSVFASPTVTTTYYLSDANNGACVVNDSITIYVITPPVINANIDQTVCAGETVNLAGTYASGLTTTWSAPSGSFSNPADLNAVFTPSITNGSVNLLLISDAFSVCPSDTDMMVVTVNPLPNVDAGNDLVLCSGESATLSGSGANTYNWNNGVTDGLSFIPAASNSYTVTGTDVNGCINTDIMSITVNELPVANFSANGICENSNMIFNDLSTINAPQTITNYQWTFGNGQTSSLQNPSILFAAENVYSNSLIVTSNNGCVDTISIDTEVWPIPVADFNVADVCEEIQSIFNNTSTVSNTNTTNTISSYTWDFGDGNTSVLTNPTHTYSSEGTYSVVLTATSANGCVGTQTYSTTVFDKPLASFTVLPVCSGDVTNFLDASTVNAPENISNYDWSFGNAQTSNLQNPTLTFASENIYNNTLIITTANGCMDTVTNQNIVWPLPITDFTLSNVCEETQSVFTNSSTISSVNTPNTIVNYTWDFGDGNSSNVINPNHLYGSEGTYDVLLTATSSNGCISSQMYTTTVYDKPLASFTVSPVCLGNQSAFNDASTIVAPDLIGTYEWTFGNAQTSFTQNPNVQFGSENIYNNTLIITSSNGCKDTFTLQNTVWPLPEVDFSVSEVCFGLATNFADLSTISNVNSSNTNTSWDWTFGDGNTGSGNNASNTYSSDGTYSVTLTVTSDHNCSNDFTKDVIVNPTPQASFNGIDLSGCSPICPTVTSTSNINAPGIISQYEWIYSDGFTDNGNFTSRCLENNSGATEAYDLSLIITSDNGCKDTLTSADFIKVYHLPTANFTFTPENPDIFNNTVDFTNLSNNADSYAWTFGDDGSSTEIDPQIVFDLETGMIDIMLVASTIHDCRDTAYSQVEIKDIIYYYVPNSFTPDGDEFNQGFKAEFGGDFDPYNFKMEIYNRWGELIFQTNDVEVGWDGSFKGELSMQGTYTWKITFKEKALDKRREIVGHVNLLR